MRRLSGWDAYLLYAETPTVHTHTLKVLIVDPNAPAGPMTFERFKQAFASFLPQLGPLRFELLEMPLGLHHPMWLENADVDLAQHVFKVTLPAPGRRRELDELVGEIGSSKLDRTKPLWTIHYVDGLAGGRVALVAKIHHALADGIASANAVSKVISGTLQLAPEESGARRRPTNREILISTGRAHVQAIRGLPSLLQRTLQSVRRARAARDLYAPGDLRMLDAPETFLNLPLSPLRSFGSESIPLSAVKRVGEASSATVNDVVLALVAGALRQLFIDRGEEPVALIASVPVSTNRDPDRVYGNHLAGFFLTLPTDEKDALVRLSRVHDSASLAKQRFEVLNPNLYDDWVEYLPPRPSAAIFRFLSTGRLTKRNPLFNVPVSNVPGPRRRGHIVGMPVLEIYSVGPVMDRSAVNITIWSYDSRLGIGVIADKAVLPNAGDLAALIGREIVELEVALGLTLDPPMLSWDEEPSPVIHR